MEQLPTTFQSAVTEPGKKRGFTSLFGAVFIIAFETGKVVDNKVFSKHCAGCNYWEKREKSLDEYVHWKCNHKCDANFTGSAGAMEPGVVSSLKRSLDFNIRYTGLFSDGDSKTLSLLLAEKPYVTVSEKTRHMGFFCES